MVRRLERALLNRVKLDPLHLDLEDWRNAGNGAELISLRAFNTDLLFIKSAIEGSVNVARSMSHVDFNVAPTLLFRPNATSSGDVGLASTIEQTKSYQYRERLGVSVLINSLLDLVKLLAVVIDPSRLDRTLTLEENIVDYFCHVLLCADFDLF